MLIAGYENQSNESLRYWRTRFVVIPTDEVPQSNVGPAGEKLNEEEIRLMGMDKLAELFSKLRWQPPEEKGKLIPPVRFVTTDLGPVASVLDESLVSQLDDIHAADDSLPTFMVSRERGFLPRQVIWRLTLSCRNLQLTFFPI